MPRMNCVGIGLLSLDVLIDNNEQFKSQIFAGGSCGNVLSILSFLGFNSFPIARLAENIAADLIIQDLSNSSVKLNFISKENKGSTPIIIHRLLDSSKKGPRHRFEFRNPINGSWLSSFRPVLAKKVIDIESGLPNVDIFYLDRVSRSSLELAKIAKNKGAIIFFEPSSLKDRKQFEECLSITNILKYSSDRLKSYKSDYPERQVDLEIETTGREGLDFRFNNNKWITQSPFLIDNVVDSAGAGDWCSAGIIKILLESKNNGKNNLNSSSVNRALQFGQALGALNCRYPGARGMMYSLSLNEVVDLVSSIFKDFNLKPNSNTPKLLPHLFEITDLEMISASQI